MKLRYPLKAFMAMIVLPTWALPQKILVCPDSQSSEDDQSCDFSQCISFDELPFLTEHQKEKLDDFLKEKKDFGYDLMDELEKRLTLSPQSTAELTGFMDDFFSRNFKYSAAKKELLDLVKKHYGFNSPSIKKQRSEGEDTAHSTKNIPPIKKSDESNLTR